MAVWRNAAVVSLVLWGCPPRDPVEVPAADAGRPPRVGVKVPLPDGWTARVGSDQGFRAGPGDRVVLRIDKRPSDGGGILSAEELERQLLTAMPGVRATRLGTASSEDHVVLRLRLQGAPDAGTRSSVTVALGAKRMGDDVFLCATEPGASEDEIEKAAVACAGISLAPQAP